ncbi:MAG: VTT domain-containing protein [Sedimentibacter sp.]|uniref:TVP38/TMEM64 family protein n=1 Tax=Sedimentibacter sp. TaxID=1960295 RepID=UPI003157F6F1
MNKKRRYCYIAAAVAFLALLLTFIGTYKKLIPLAGEILSKILEYTGRSPILTTAAILLLYVLKTVIMVIPETVLYISAGLIFPLPYAILLNYTGIVLEMSLGFFLGRYLGKHKMSEMIKKNKYADRVVKFENDNSILSSFLVRIIKGPPLDLTSMFLGSTGMDYVPYLAGTLLGLSPGMILSVFIGRSVDNPISFEFMVPFFIYLVLILTAIIVFKLKTK